jgi:uroporphyrinogen decarboxylase
VINTFDPSIEAEALGCTVEWDREDQLPKVVSHPLAEGKDLADLEPEWEKKCRIPMILDITKRLTMLLAKKAAVIGVITGPLTLARHLRGDDIFNELREDTPYSAEVLNFASQCCLKLAKLYAELKVDGILMVEEYFDRVEDELISKLDNGFLSIWNVLHYFAVPLLLLGKGFNEEKASKTIGCLRVDGFILDARLDLLQLKEPARDHDLCLAATIPNELLLADPKPIRETLSAKLRETYQMNGFFLSNEWEIPYNTPPQNIHEIMKIIKDYK